MIKGKQIIFHTHSLGLSQIVYFHTQRCIFSQMRNIFFIYICCLFSFKKYIYMWRKSSQNPTLYPLSLFPEVCLARARLPKALSSEWSHYSETTLLVLKTNLGFFSLPPFLCSFFHSFVRASPLFYFFTFECSFSHSLTCLQGLQYLPPIFFLISGMIPLSSSHGYSIFLTYIGWFG